MAHAWKCVLSASLVALVGAWGAACGAFSLNAVEPPPNNDAATDAMPKGGDAHGAVDSSLDASDAASCDPGDDPCACLTSTLVTSGAGAVYGVGVADSTVYWIASVKQGKVALYGLPTSAVDAAGPPSLGATFNWNGDDLMPIQSGSLFLGVAVSSMVTKIQGFPLDGGTPNTLRNVPTRTSGLRLGDGGIYWTDQYSEVCYLRLDGSPPGGSPDDSGCGSKPLVASVHGGNSNSNDLSMNSTSLYLSVDLSGEIFTAPLAGGEARLIYTGDPGQRLLSASDEDLVWSELSDGGGVIKRALLDGGDIVGLATTPAPVVALLTDGETLYFAAAWPLNDSVKNGQMIGKVPREAGTVTVLACDPNAPNAIALDSTFLYWGDISTNGIWKVVK